MSLEIVQNLVDLYPQGIHEQDDEGRLPAQVACDVNGKDVHVVENWSQVARNVDERTDFVRLFVETHPDGLRVPDKHGLLLLHTACQTGVSFLQIVQLLVEAHPEDGLRMPSMGAPPFLYNPPWMRGDQGSLNALVPSGPFPPAFGNPVTANPMQTALRNVQPLTTVIGGKLPLHYALNNNIDGNDVVKLHVVRLLVQTHPEGLRVPMNKVCCLFISRVRIGCLYRLCSSCLRATRMVLVYRTWLESFRFTTLLFAALTGLIFCSSYSNGIQKESM